MSTYNHTPEEQIVELNRRIDRLDQEIHFDEAALALALRQCVARMVRRQLYVQWKMALEMGKKTLLPEEELT